VVRSDGKPSRVTTATRRAVFLYARMLLRRALDCGEAARLGLDTGFIAAMPEAGPDPRRSRNPLTDLAAMALADEANLCQLAEVHHPNDRGVRDAWEALVFTGRRCSEVLQLRLDCIGRYAGRAGRYDRAGGTGGHSEALPAAKAAVAAMNRTRAQAR
jgi:integrase